MLLLKVALLVISASVVHGFLVAPKIVSPFDVTFRGLAAVPREVNNAFDLLDGGLREALSKELGIIEPNEIQNASLPITIHGNDTFVIAQTGSGKTMSFILPILHRLNNTSSSSSQRSVAIVIGPTSELLAQHSTTASTLMSSIANRILFKTPQQLLDSNVANDEDFANIDIVVIDEVDAVLCGSEFNDTTPEASIELLGRLPDRAQYILTTAHLTRAHTKIINRLFPDITTIRQSSSSQRVLVPTLRQVFHYFSGDMRAKLDKLQDILEKSEKQSTIIFCKDENEVEAVHLFLQGNDTMRDAFAPEKLHVDLSSEERSGALSRFRTDDNECRMLVTHEIAARGLDCPSVRHVVLFDTPTDVTAFVHRAGRTARAGAEGVVTCLIQSGGAGSLGSFGDSGGSFGQHKNLHALLDAPKLNFAKATTDDEVKEKKN
jgi:superfamily II DNA/RNA helicase